MLIDTCGWVAIVEARINIDVEFGRLLGKVEMKFTQSVRNELQRLQKKHPRRRLLLELLEKRGELLDATLDGGYTDDELVSLSAEYGWPVLTVDRDLKDKLHKANCSVIQVVSGNRLELVE